MAILTEQETRDAIETLAANMLPLTSKTVSMQPEITLSESKLRELWNKGVLPDLAYVAFALEIAGNNNLDVEAFSRGWSIAAEDLTEFDYENGWKPKKLKKRSILNAICILEEKLFATSQQSVQVQLSLFD